MAKYGIERNRLTPAQNEILSKFPTVGLLNSSKESAEYCAYESDRNARHVYIAELLTRMSRTYTLLVSMGATESSLTSVIVSLSARHGDNVRTVSVVPTLNLIKYSSVDSMISEAPDPTVSSKVIKLRADTPVTTRAIRDLAKGDVGNINFAFRDDVNLVLTPRRGEDELDSKRFVPVKASIIWASPTGAFRVSENMEFTVDVMEMYSISDIARQCFFEVCQQKGAPTREPDCEVCRRPMGAELTQDRVSLHTGNEITAIIRIAFHVCHRCQVGLAIEQSARNEYLKEGSVPSF